MNKRISKLTGILLALLLMFSVTSTVFAEATLFPDKGTLTIHKYLMDDISGAGLPSDGNEAAPGTLPDDAKPLNGITFNLYKVTIPETGTVPVNSDCVFDKDTLKLTSDGVEYDVVVASTASVTTAGGTDEAPEGIATATDLSQGYYLVVEQASDKVASIAYPFVVAVPMTNPDGSGWIENVHVYPKNEDMTVEKNPVTSSVNVGEEITWSILISVPSDIKNFKKFNITDVMSNTLDFVPDSVKVTALDTKDAETGTELDEQTHWTSTHDSGSNKLTVEINEDGRTALDGSKFVRVDFKTIVNKGILDLENNTVNNTAVVETKDSLDNEKDTSTTTPSNVHTASIRIDKTDANTGKPLEGAVFQIASSEENAKKGIFLKKKSDGTILDVDQDGYDDDNVAKVWTETTAMNASDTNAYATFKGIKDYTEDAKGVKTYISYWVVETKAPTGYNLLSAPEQVTFDENSKSDNSFTATQVIKNTTGFTLPQTGGMGATIFTVSGICLVGIAVIMLIITHRKKSKNN